MALGDGAAQARQVDATGWELMGAAAIVDRALRRYLTAEWPDDPACGAPEDAQSAREAQATAQDPETAP